MAVLFNLNGVMITIRVSPTNITVIGCILLVSAIIVILCVSHVSLIIFVVTVSVVIWIFVIDLSAVI